MSCWDMRGFARAFRSQMRLLASLLHVLLPQTPLLQMLPRLDLGRTRLQHPPHSLPQRIARLHVPRLNLHRLPHSPPRNHDSPRLHSRVDVEPRRNGAPGRQRRAAVERDEFDGRGVVNGGRVHEAREHGLAGKRVFGGVAQDDLGVHSVSKGRTNSVLHEQCFTRDSRAAPCRSSSRFPQLIRPALT